MDQWAELSNAPVVDLDRALDPASLAAWIEFSYSAHAAAIDALLTRFVKFSEVTASGIADDFVAGHAADFAKELKAAINALDETRTRIKKPVLHAQRMIDGSAKKLSESATAAVLLVEARITEYLRLKEAEARKTAEAEAARLQAEAELKVAEALMSPLADLDQAAFDALNLAQEANELANARALELLTLHARRGRGYCESGLVDKWTYSVENLAIVPPHFLMINDAAVKLAIKQGERIVPGLRIWNDTRVMVR